MNIQIKVFDLDRDNIDKDIQGCIYRMEREEFYLIKSETVKGFAVHSGKVIYPKLILTFKKQ